MTRMTLGIDGLPLPVLTSLKQVGEHIRLARKRRGMTMEQLAQAMLVTRKTLSRLEAGEPGISLGVLASALHVLNLEDSLTALAAPETDKGGVWLDKMSHVKTKRVRARVPDNLKF